MKGIDFVIFGARDWNNDWITQHRLATSLSKKGHRVLFVENTGVRSLKLKDFPRIIERIKNWFSSTRGFRQINDNLAIYSPILIPFPYSRIAKLINSFFFNRILKYWLNKNRYNNIVFITFLATPLINDFIENSSYTLKIYYSSDNHEVASENKQYLFSERQIINSSNLVFVTSQKLYEKFEILNTNVFKIPSGVELEKFDKINEEIIPEDIKKISKPIVGFIGGINSKINIDLILSSAKNLKNYSFVMIGECENNLVKKLSIEKNIFFLGKKDHSVLKNYVKNFDCAIMPYKLNKFTDAIYPAKLNELLAVGKPVVSTNIYEMSSYNQENDNIIDVANSNDEFSNLIKMNIENDSEQKLKKRNLISQKNSWSSRFLQITDIINKSIINKKIENFNWEKNFILEYNKIKQKIFKYSFIVIIFYFLFFVSPFPYFLGQNLVVNDLPKKSDVIIGLSGYGQESYINNSYQQRALDVFYYYNNRMGKKIILSGRKQLIEEFDLMKALLVSMGVPKKDIILLKIKSSSTFENIQNIKTLMDEEKFKSANIITGTYHQKRLKITLNKVINNKNFQLVPETNVNKDKMWFFELSKLKVIFYEFISIIYNLIKFKNV
ncbi:YdcF family protein [Candidatus Pelagibacter sp.]|nr:YdcF family protein [Candidatus Pelagibacter sp.]